MSYHGTNYEKPCANDSRLKSLQLDLTKSNETYNYQKNKIEQLQIQANQLQQKSQDNLKPSEITFKKTKSN